ncbi:DUF1629 domain-containing protein [Frigidibacter sp. SD6-1]|uniref:imm11 family protein n=1 Tax=Frigidibacter sp. SD6-1 TaxID=3032581 RepID=UPI0024DF68F4|nr:DUF1629 domain-containing protein [Frigidibacter sp. SD6-1]
MAWAVMRPSGMGDYQPFGSFVGWREARERYFWTEMSDAEKIAQGMKVDEYSGLAFTRKFDEDKGLLAPQELPREFRTDKTERNLASWILPAGILAVDGAMKEIIERLEPGVHQFWPMTVSMPKDQVYPRDFHGLVIHRHLNAFLPEASDRECWSGGEIYPGVILYRIRESKAGCAGIALSKAVTGGAHLWRDQQITGGQIFMSDALQAEIAKAGLRMPKQYKVKEV